MTSISFRDHADKSYLSSTKKESTFEKVGAVISLLLFIVAGYLGLNIAEFISFFNLAS